MYMKNMITIWPTLDPLFKVSFHHVTLLMLDCVPHIMNKAKPQFLVIWLHWTSTFIELLYRSNRRRAKPLLFQESFISLATQKKTQQTNYSRAAFFIILMKDKYAMKHCYRIASVVFPFHSSEKNIVKSFLKIVNCSPARKRHYYSLQK